MTHPSGADLGRVPLLAHLPDDVREELAGRFDVEQFDVGHDIVVEGNAGYVFYLIDQGRAVVTHEGRELRTLGPGDFLVEIAIIGSGRRTATVTVVEPVTAWSLFGTRFRVLQAERPDVADALLDATNERVGDG